MFYGCGPFTPLENKLSGGSPKSGSWPPADDTTTLSQLPEWMVKDGVPGVQVAWWTVEDGARRYSHGLSNCKTRALVGPETVFEAASLSKPLFSYGVLLLAQEGRLDLDLPLSELVPNYILDPRLERVTARLVLSHRSGFPNWRGQGKKLSFERDPGAEFGYSGEGFVYLQRAVEVLTAQPMDVFMAERVLKPLGMEHSTYAWKPMAPDTRVSAEGPSYRIKALDLQSDVAIGHELDGRWGDKLVTEANAASSLHTTADDYLRFLRTVTGHQEGPLNRDGLELFTHSATPVQTFDEGEVSWGLGWGLCWLGNQAPTAFHWGDNEIYLSFTATRIDNGDGLVVLTNGASGFGVLERVTEQILGPAAVDLAFRWLRERFGY